MTEAIPAIIPAAGRSHRMGTLKPLLDAGGSTFLARILCTLREGGADPLIVVLRDKGGPVEAEAREHGAGVILNPHPAQGPVSSLRAGLRAVPAAAEAVLFAPVDHPLFHPGTVRALIEAFRRTGAPVVIPSFEGWRGHPVLFSRQVFPELLDDVLPEGARTVVRRYLSERVQVQVDDAGILADIDTPEDYRKHFS